jgi:hypothetical protein
MKESDLFLYARLTLCEKTDLRYAWLIIYDLGCVSGNSGGCSCQWASTLVHPLH